MTSAHRNRRFPLYQAEYQPAVGSGPDDTLRWITADCTQFGQNKNACAQSISPSLRGIRADDVAGEHGARPGRRERVVAVAEELSPIAWPVCAGAWRH